MQSNRLRFPGTRCFHNCPLSILQALISSLSLLCLISLYPFNAESQGYCGPDAQADIVFMLQKSQNISDPVLEQQRDFVRSILNHFSAFPAAANKPQIAIGTYNWVGTPPSAGILTNAHLTEDYGLSLPVETRLYEALSGISGQTGDSELVIPLQVAEGELIARANSANRIIVLLSNGVPSRPITDFCADSSLARNNAIARANLSKTNGFTIYTVHIEDDLTCMAGTGSSLLQQMASSPAHYLEMSAGAQSLISSLSGSIACDDSDPCTADTCNLLDNTCYFSTIDSDGDGAPDCNDLCPGADDTLLGQSCLSGLGQCQQSGSLICSGSSLACNAAVGTPGVEVCDGIDNNCNGESDEGGVCLPPTPTPDLLPLDCLGVPGGAAVLDRCGVCQGDGLSCLCRSINTSGTVSALSAQALKQYRAMRNSVQWIYRRHLRSGYETRVVRLYKRLKTCSRALPSSVQSCEAEAGCIQSNGIRTKSKSCEKLSLLFVSLSREVAAVIEAQYPTGGLCHGRVSECRARRIAHRQKVAKTLSSALYQQRLYQRILGRLPKAQSQC